MPRNTQQLQRHADASTHAARKSTSVPVHEAGPVYPLEANGSMQSADEALARALQQQFDNEAKQQADRAQQDHSASFPKDVHPSHPSLQSGASSGSAQATQSAGACPAAQPYLPPPHSTAHAAPDRNTVLAPRGSQLPPPSRDSCAGCGKSLLGFGSLLSHGGQYITALDRCWHPSCLTCAACRLPIGGAGGMQFIAGEKDGLPYHPECHRQLFHPRCMVCTDLLPMQGSNKIVWSEVPFWKDRYCPSHATDGTKRCTGCTRLQPSGEEWAALDDGRVLCLPCLATLVPDTSDCQPLYDAILRFYQGMGMALPVRPPMMLVESGALNRAERNETHGSGRSGPVFHTRGLCLTEEYTSFTTVMRVPSARGMGGRGGGGGGLLGGLRAPAGFSLQPHTVQLGPSRTEVTAILVLYGMPYLLTGSVLAHEVMHAWLRLSGYPRLAPEVEEGMCQLMALLWLEAQQQQRGSYEERLASFLAHQIRTDPSVIYGDGFRAALEAFQRFGLQTMLAHLRAAGKLPS